MKIKESRMKSENNGEKKEKIFIPSHLGPYFPGTH